MPAGEKKGRAGENELPDEWKMEAFLDPRELPVVVLAVLTPDDEHGGRRATPPSTDERPTLAGRCAASMMCPPSSQQFTQDYSKKIKSHQY